jgi:hypothetical protein
MTASLFFICGRPARAQSPDVEERKVEVGAQVTVLNVSSVHGFLGFRF